MISRRVAILALTCVISGCASTGSSVPDVDRQPAAVDVAPDPSVPPTSVSPTSPSASTAVSSQPSVAEPAAPATVSETSLAAASTSPATARPQLEGLRVAITGIAEFEEPIAMAVRPGGDPLEPPYVLERGGVVRRLAEGDEVALDVSELTSPGGEQGVLGMAFAPDASRLYLNYTDADGDTHVDEFTVDTAGAIDADSRREVLTVDQPYGNHNGGNLAFGPDGMLYIGLGDGGAANDPERRALDLTSLLGKILRIDPRPTADDLPYSVPPDNPYVGIDDARPEIWSIGLRNPWRYSFDRVTGDLWIGDVGQGEWEEIDVALAGRGAGRGVNYGWSAFEGTHRFNDDQPDDGHTPPVWEFAHGDDGCSVTGGYVYRGSAIPELIGAYVFGDYCSGKIWAAAPGPAGEISEVFELGKVGDLASFGEDADGELYLISLKGSVSRIDPA